MNWYVKLECVTHFMCHFWHTNLIRIALTWHTFYWQPNTPILTVWIILILSYDFRESTRSTNPFISQVPSGSAHGSLPKETTEPLKSILKNRGDNVGCVQGVVNRSSGLEDDVNKRTLHKSDFYYNSWKESWFKCICNFVHFHYILCLWNWFFPN